MCALNRGGIFIWGEPMANEMYRKGLEAFLRSQIDWERSTIRAVLLDLAAYQPNLLTDQFLSVIPEAARVAISPALTQKTATDGVADAADLVIPSVGGAEAEALALFADTGNPATSRLICLIDTAVGLPAAAGGSDISIIWDNGANKIFRL